MDKKHKLKNYKPTSFMLPTSRYDKRKADHAVAFIQNLNHTKGEWAGQAFELIAWQEELIRNIFGVVKVNGYRQFNTTFVETSKKAVNQSLPLLWLCIYSVPIKNREARYIPVLPIESRQE